MTLHKHPEPPRDSASGREADRSTGRPAGVPNTDASESPATQWAVLPGSPAYREWLGLLQRGEISYDEFIDWTTPDATRSLAQRLRDAARTIRAGLGGAV